VLLPSKEDLTEAEKRRADSAEHRAALLEARLRALGLEP
jgi:hypothetical protein